MYITISLCDDMQLLCWKINASWMDYCLTATDCRSTEDLQNKKVLMFVHHSFKQYEKYHLEEWQAYDLINVTECKIYKYSVMIQ